MSEFSIRTLDGRIAFEPGEEITVVAEWQCPVVPPSLEIRLGWTTAGKGTIDYAIEKSIAIENARPSETREVKLQLPEAPYSFSGKLISLVWSLELFTEPGSSPRMEITIAPGAKEIELHQPMLSS